MMIDEPYPDPTYHEVVCELKWNPTENRETLEKIILSFVMGDIVEDIRSDGTYLVVRNNTSESLQLIGDWIRSAKLLDTIRKRLFKSIVGNLTAIYFNRQAAAMQRLSLVDVEDDPPLGAIVVQIVSDGLAQVIDTLTPKTYRGRELTEKEWERVRQKEYRLKKKKAAERNN